MQDNLSKAYSVLLTPKINSKTEALTYAIEVTKTADGLHIDQAERVFRMFLDNIELPDTSKEPINKFYDQATESIKAMSGLLEKQLKLQAGEEEKAHEEETTTEAVKETGTTVEVEIEKQQE